MSDLSIILFDDARARDWEPFTLTRPAGELLFGTLTFRERAERVFGGRVVRHLTAADHLLAFEEAGAPGVAPFDAAPTGGDRLFLLSRAVPAWSESGRAGRLTAGPITVGDGVSGWFAPAGTPPPSPAFLEDPAGHGDGGTRVEGMLIEHVWELVSSNAAQIAADIAALHPDRVTREIPPGVFHWGDHPLVIHETARLEPGCAIDTSGGPVWIDRDASVRSFTRLCGPSYIGPGSQVLGGSIDSVSLGPVCRVHGELASSVCLGYSNKQHDGHLGKAYVGRWVNIGAGTTNSDLKNNYGHIRMWTPAGEVDTGEVKLGCLLGDHVKTGIGLLLNTGTVVGAGSNLYGAELPPTFVPPFSWGMGSELTEYRLDKFLEVAERAMERREVRLTDGMRDQLEQAFRRGRAQAGTASGEKG